MKKMCKSNDNTEVTSKKKTKKNRKEKGKIEIFKEGTIKNTITQIMK